jgi:hypothetical protein
MLSRLFMTDDPNYVPTVETQLNITTDGMSPYDFLTEGDRAALSDIYASAQDRGVDLKYVDGLAFDLGMYRKYGSVMHNAHAGGMFDNEGHAQTFSFTEKDAATADRILSGNSIAGSTRLDPGFLRYELDPGYSFNHAANFDFLEQVVNNVSNAGGKAKQQFDTKFSSFVANGQNDFIVNTASEVTLPALPADDPLSSSPLDNLAKSPELKTLIQKVAVIDTMLTSLNKKKSAPSSLFDFLAMWQNLHVAQDKTSNDVSKN